MASSITQTAVIGRSVPGTFVGSSKGDWVVGAVVESVAVVEEVVGAVGEAVCVVGGAAGVVGVVVVVDGAAGVSD